jgi:hypothetical protein
MPYVGGTVTYGDICRKVAESGYEGFLLREAGAPPAVIPKT